MPHRALTTRSPSPRVTAGGHLPCTVTGDGPPLLYLHGLRSDRSSISEFLSLLGEGHRTFFPTMPGFGSSEAHPTARTVDDISYAYLEWLDANEIEGSVLVGSSIGAWLALEMVTKCASRFASLVVISPLGLRQGPPELRYYPDIFSLSPDEVDGLLWADPQRAKVDLAALDDDALAAHLRDREAVANYGWDPYLHTPKLVNRLSLITIPTLIVRGEADGLVSENAASVLAERIDDAQLITIPSAGHFVDVEQPMELAQAIKTFIATGTGAAPRGVSA